ncbi:MAG TPA: phosphatase PAP2 family protein [Gemmatimonadaceae bacterium]|nr:phosphatase PAP2 family protein [Gemmatimonadaceae bacterium]
MSRSLRAVVAAGSVCLAQSVAAQASILSVPQAGFHAPDSLRQAHTAVQLQPPSILPLHATSVARGAPHFVRSSFVAVGVAAGVSLLDEPVMRAMDPYRSSDGTARRASVLFASLGGFVPLTVGSLLWAGGKVAGHDVLEHVGMESTQAVMLSGALTIGIKGLVGRSRPNAAPGDADEYRPGRGFFDARSSSFPSGHTSAAFALATVLSRELSGRYPSRKWLIRSALYGMAGTVGVARMYQNAHWPSDVVTGAALGTLSGMQALSWHAGRQ